MKFSINRNTLLNILQFVSKAIPTRSTLPIIGCALFTQNNNKLNVCIVFQNCYLICQYD